jgi:hypothetical protein
LTARLLLPFEVVKRAFLAIFLVTLTLGTLGTLGCSGSSPMAAAPTPLTLQVGGNAGLTKKGQTAQLTAMVAFSDGTTVDKASSAVWMSLKPDVALVNPAGMVTAVDDGKVVITATFQSIAGSTEVTVDLPKADVTP